MTRAVSSAVSLHVYDPTAMPTWRAGQSINQWREITGSSLSLCPPSVNYGSKNVAARMDTWCGLALDTRNSTVWSCGNGGHDDWWGNDVYKINLRANSPAWVEVIAATSGYSLPNDSGRYSDGSPASAHSYYAQQVIERRNRAIRFGNGASSTIGNPKPDIDGVNLSTLQWEPAGTYPNWAATFDSDVPVCKNTLTEDIYMFMQNYSVRKWTEATNTVSLVNSSPPTSMTKAATCFDPVRGRIFLVNALGAFTYDIASNTFTARTLAGSGSMITVNAQGCVYEPTLDRYLSFIAQSGTIKVYSTDPVTFAVSPLSVTGTDPAINVGPNGGGNPYGKWNYDPFLQGVIGFTNHAANGFFLRTH